jgi:hypothetical protein
MGVVIQAMLAMSGRVTMLGISRWAEKGGSYRTVQRFFNTRIDWGTLFFRFFRKHHYQPGATYILAGDESVVTKAGHKTHGLDRFYAGLFNKPVKSIAVFASHCLTKNLTLREITSQGKLSSQGAVLHLVERRNEAKDESSIQAGITVGA